MEQLKHECGIALIRLLKPLDYYQHKYGTWMYGLNKLYLMMEKQHNRGQEGAGMACVKLDTVAGNEYMFREKAPGSNAITQIFAKAQGGFKDLAPEKLSDVKYAKENLPFAGELYMGHLRYSTGGRTGMEYIHPFLRRNNWKAKNLCLCGNFSMTNTEEIFEKLTAQGQYPRIFADSYVMLELMGHRLDREVERNFIDAKELGHEGKDITKYIDNNVDMANVLRTTMPDFDGGYVVAGVTGSGEMFTMRDPWGIRSAFYYQNDEIIAIASERPVLQTTFDIECDDVQELQSGQSLIISKDGKVRKEQIIEQRGFAPCSFERIYFSRGSDRDIYRERKMLGQMLTPSILKAIDNDVDHTVFSFIPNTAEVSYYGMLTGIKTLINDQKIEEIEKIGKEGRMPTRKELEVILNRYSRSEKVAWKDIKLRTFITEGNSRNDLASHVYDITYEVLEKGVDNLVVIDDSIVRGTTLRESILKILDRLHPKKIVIVSSAPQIRYPDYYGIDMAYLEEFIAFRACIELLKERGMHSLIDDTYRNCKEELQKPKAEMRCCVKDLYKPFTVDELNEKMVEMLRPAEVTTPIEFVFQSIEGLHEACPNNKGDWYFTGNFPTPGGMKLVNKAYISYYENVYRNGQKF